ncbi:MAG: 7-carboxy-7-deazaguanine synthase QueE [Deferribacterales bacterium]
MVSGYIKEVFKSIQGEGKYVGVLQLFVRFAGCSVGCKGCDTDFLRVEQFNFLDIGQLKNPIDVDLLVDYIVKYVPKNSIHSISITGGEPLDQLLFLTELSKRLKGNGYKLFLETSGFLIENLNKVGEWFDIISLDFKLKSSFGREFSLEEIGKISKDIVDKIYVKTVISKNITVEDIDILVKGLKILNKNEIYLHFLDNSNIINDNILNYFYGNDINAYFIPQIHKYLEIR